jgi:ubiquitin-like 1-activating enzyme E1 B
MSNYSESKVLVIGAGGIGCELIKNLAQMGVGSMTVVDLDTIDISNLNRQFLFRREHVGKPKAQIASLAAKRLNPRMQVEYLCENVKKFNHSFVAKFDVVFSALDNIDARRYLNRLCLTANKPLIEAGSTGYIGQSRVILKNLSECYECQKKEAPKVYPVCTIRSAPSTPVHCIQWAKLLFELLFGPGDDSSVIKDMHIQSESPVDYLCHLFHDDILEQQKLVDKWVDKKPPIPLDMRKWTAACVDGLEGIPSSESLKILTIDQYVEMFLVAVRTILRERTDMIGQLFFTKDDPVAVDFVAAASNLRMHNYHIPLISRWDIESIAGAIVPAIATTNAIVAGLQCFNFEQILSSINSAGRDLWIRYPHPSGNGSIVQSSKPAPPNKDCFICQNKILTLSVSSYETCSLNEFVETVIKDALSIAEPCIIMNGNLIYDALEDDDSILQQYSQSLSEWGFSNAGQMIQVEDSSTNETYHVSVSEKGAEENEPLQFTTADDVIVPSKRAKTVV